MPKFPLLAAAVLSALPIAGAVAHDPPLEARVVRHFEVPAQAWSPGNRGLEYAVASGVVVKASAAGTVTFAGAVAGSRYVTITHADGVRTSYSYLDRIDVKVGQQVVAGAPIATTTDSFQFGARRGDAYIDPNSLFDRRGVHLVPLDAPTTE